MDKLSEQEKAETLHDVLKWDPIERIILCFRVHIELIDSFFKESIFVSYFRLCLFIDKWLM